METERRHEERIKNPRVSVACVPLGKAVATRENVARALLDISTSGARVLLDQPLAAGDPVMLRLDHETSKKSLYVAGEVRWVANLPARVFVAGIRIMRARGLLEIVAT